MKRYTEHGDQVKERMKQGVRVAACENRMKKKSLHKAALVSGVRTVPSGAVEVLQKQRKGYGYFKS